MRVIIGIGERERFERDLGYRKEMREIRDTGGREREILEISAREMREIREIGERERYERD